MIYLDYAATTPLDPAVLEAMLPYLTEAHANPASDHRAGRRARLAVETARGQVAAAIGADINEIVWTSGATESDNLAIKGAVEFYGLADARTHVVSCRTEHKAVLDTCRHLETRGVRVSYVTPNAEGRVSAAQIMEALEPDTRLVTLMWVNNETGAINDIEALAPQLADRGVLFHVDAAQAPGRVPIDLKTTPISLMSLSGHKAYGPKGIGALFVRRRPRARLAPQLHGGGHEQGMRSGTLPTHQIVGMGTAFRLAAERRERDGDHARTLRAALIDSLGTLEDIYRNGADEGCVPQILNLSFDGVEGESLRAGLPELAVSSGSACSSATREPSYVLRALGRSDALAGASLRLSYGRFTTEAEVREAGAAIAGEVRRLRALSPLWE